LNNLTEEETKLRYITPALEKSGWDKDKNEIRMEHRISDGMVCVTKQGITRGERKRVDYLLSYPLSPNHHLKLAIIEAKAYHKPLQEGLAQAINYAKDLDVKFAYSSNGKGFLEYDFFTGKTTELNEFPTKEELYARYIKGKDFTKDQEKSLQTPYYLENNPPRYYQENAINRSFDAVMQGQKRILLVMATGTGKTYTAFQIAYRLHKEKKVKKILFLADRNVLIDQTLANDFKSFAKVSTKIQKHRFDPSYEVYFGIYQQFISYDEATGEATYHFKGENGFKPDFFDLIFVDECHRGSAREDSTWREILEYFHPAIQIGLTATPNAQRINEQSQTDKTTYTKENSDELYISSNFDYFGEPLYTYSLKQGIEDGFLAPYKVVRYITNLDKEGLEFEWGKTDKYGNVIPEEKYQSSDFNRKIFIDEHIQTIAKKISDFLKHTLKSPFAKTIVFCETIEHAQLMRDALRNENAEQMRKNADYIVSITGEEDRKEELLEKFSSINETYPVIATTSKLLSTGVDTKMVKLIVLAKHIKSMTEFKQILGRGTRLLAEQGKSYFVVLDFTGATTLFNDPDFDGNFESFTLENGEIKKDNPQSPQEQNNADVEVFPPQEPTPKPSQKIYVNGIDCFIENEKEQVLDANGKLISTDFKEFSKQNSLNTFASLQDFLAQWSKSKSKNELLKSFEEKGILIYELRAREEYKNLDEFDILLSLCFNQATLTRAQRAKKANKILTEYEGKARQILEILIDKYAKFGICEFENAKIYETEPLAEFGTRKEIIEIFGGFENYQQTIIKLKEEFYNLAS